MVPRAASFAGELREEGVLVLDDGRFERSPWRSSTTQTALCRPTRRSARAGTRTGSISPGWRSGRDRELFSTPAAQVRRRGGRRAAPHRWGALVGDARRVCRAAGLTALARGAPRARRHAIGTKSARTRHDFRARSLMADHAASDDERRRPRAPHRAVRSSDAGPGDRLTAGWRSRSDARRPARRSRSSSRRFGRREGWSAGMRSSTRATSPRCVGS